MPLDQTQVNQLTSEGYTKEQIVQIQQSYDNPQQQKAPQQTSMFGGNIVNENLAIWQIEVKGILEEVEHILRGDFLKTVGDNRIWVTPTDENERIFNELGVRMIMKTMYLYLNKVHFLSNYDEDTIKEKVLDFGNNLADLIYMKYESFGWDTQEKRKYYFMIVAEMTDIVHSAYLRALGGKEREGLRTSTMVTQSDNLQGGGVNINQGMQARERSAVNPMRILKGRYY